MIDMIRMQEDGTRYVMAEDAKRAGDEFQRAIWRGEWKFDHLTVRWIEVKPEQGEPA